MQNKAHSFVVRIWREGDDQNDPQSPWRGYIDYVGKDKRLHFHDLEGITRFIQQELDLPTAKKSQAHDVHQIREGHRVATRQKLLAHISSWLNLGN